MRPRLSPSFVVALLALVLAAGGTGYAAGKITSGQIKDSTIKSRDVKNGALKGVDVKDGALAGADVQDGGLTGADVQDGGLTGADISDGSLGRAELNRACAGDDVSAFGGCVRRASTGPSSFEAAVADCNQRNGRLPTTVELGWIATHAEFAWANGQANQYEFTGDYSGTAPFTPAAFAKGGAPFGDASAASFWHHCVTY